MEAAVSLLTWKSAVDAAGGAPLVADAVYQDSSGAGGCCPARLQLQSKSLLSSLPLLQRACRSSGSRLWGFIQL